MSSMKRSLRSVSASHTLLRVAPGAVLMLALASTATAQDFRKRLSNDDSEIPSAAETIGATSMPIIDGRPLRTPTEDTPAWQTKAKSSTKDEAPSIFTRMSRGTKRFFASTRDAFSIRRTETKSRMVGQHTGWQQTSKPKEKPSWFGSLFAEEKPEPATPQEWLSQPRPKMF